MEAVKDIIIYGFGRMGVTHYAILNGLNSSLNFSVLETNKKLVAILKKNFPNIAFYTEEEQIPSTPYDLCLITAPPFIHTQLLEKAKERGDRKIFIEKPFGGHSNHEMKQLFEDVYIGYVLRFNPCIQWIKEHISPSEVIKAKGQYLSYTLNNKPKGWRNGEFSGVLNEMGSHVIDLLNYLLDLNQYTVESRSLRSIVSDVDDEVSVTLNSKGRSIELYFNWVKKEIRKPVFGIELELKDGRHVFVDQQVIRISQKGELVEQISVADLCVTVPFYLRGVDFTLQMQDLISHNKTNCTMAEALKVNSMINDIIKA